ncbi:MAG: hypothetical protein LBR61_08465 [Synergistaceae bacterium]|jgi:hypothetical protein|nr:hypothetical protein [Synergistaceae bacterium]
MRKRVKMFLPAVCLLLSLCGEATANTVYTTVDFSYTSGLLGLVDETLTASALVPNLTGDSAVFSFFHNSESRVAVVDRSNYAVGDRIMIYAPAQGWEVPLANESWESVVNIHSMAASGNRLYAAGFGAVGSVAGKIVEASLPDGKLTGREYALLASSDFTAHAEEVLVKDGFVYALFTQEKGEYPNYIYGPSKVVKLTLDLTPVSESDAGKNSTDMALWGDKIVIAGWGGPQGFGTSGGVDVLDLATGTVTPLLGDSFSEGVSAVCSAGGTLYFTGQTYLTAEDFFPVSTLYKWTGTAVEKVRDISSRSGYTFQLAWDGDNNALVTAAGDILLLFNPADNSLKKTLLTPELGGNLYSVAVIPNISKPNGDNDSDSDKDGGGGCNSVTGALVLILFLPLGMLRGRK